MRRLAIGLAGLLVFVLAAALSAYLLTQPSYPWTHPNAALPPKDGTSCVMVGKLENANFQHGTGIIEIAVPVIVDGHEVDERYTLVVRPLSRIRTTIAGRYLPMRLIPVDDYNSEITALASYLSAGDAAGIRAVVRRRDSRLTVEQLAPVSSAQITAATPMLDRIGTLDFDDTSILSGVINGSSGDGRRVKVDFNSLQSLSGLGVWIQLDASLTETTTFTMDGVSVDPEAAGRVLGMDFYEATGALFDNEVTVTVEPASKRLRLAHVTATSQEYLGPYPGDTGSLEESLF